MTTEEQKTELLEDFQKYLEQEHPESLAHHEQPDLNTLLSELTGLKAEVKVESRQFKNTLDTLSSALETVQDDNKTLANELSASQQRLEQQQTEIKQTMLLEVVELYDRLSTGVNVLENYQPVNTLFKNSREKDIKFIKHFKEGQLMTIKRFDKLLQSYQVRAIDCVGQLLDPITMTAVETSENTQFDNGIVLEELRKGFLYKDQVLRLAEVKVNKLK